MTDPSTNQFDPKDFIARAEALEDAIPDHVERFQSRTGKRGTVLGVIRRLIDRLTALHRELDPAEHQEIYDPSHPDAASELIAEKLVRQPRIPLAELPRFWGSGVYALYYTGNHPAYEGISGHEIPIYVGKADPENPRATTAIEQGSKLAGRLREHLRNIKKAEAYAASMTDADRRAGIIPLRLADFDCRYLVLAAAYAGAVERVLIRHFQPVWNNETGVCVGFGKHGDDPGTRANTRSDWDTLHPARKWAIREGNVAGERTPADIQARVIRHIEETYPLLLDPSDS